MQNYRDLFVWQKSHQLTLDVYKFSKGFPKEEMYGITNQIRRSSYSIPSNIAQGGGKLTKPDFANFLQISLGSANETDYLLLLSKDLDYIKSEEFEKTQKTIIEIRSMLIALIKKVRAK